MNRYLWVETIRGIFRHGKTSLAVILLSAMTFVTLGSNWFVHDLFTQTNQYLEGQMRVRILFTNEDNRSDIEELIKKEKLTNTITYLSKKEMENELKNTLKKQRDVLNLLDRNDYPSGLSFELINDTDHAQTVLQEIQETEGVRTVIYPKELASSIQDHLVSWKKGLIILTVLSGLVTLLVISVGIQLAVSQRQDEIQLKFLLGAHPLLIKGQFLLESVLLTGIGGCVSIIGIFFLNHTYQQVVAQFSFLAKTPSLGFDACVWVLLISVALGILGSILPVSRVIEKKQ